MGAFWRRDHRRQPAALGRAGEGRDPPRDRRDRERGVGSLGEGRGQAALEAARRHVARGDRRAASTSATSPTPSRPTRRSRSCGGSAPTRPQREREMRRARLPGLHHLRRLARLPRREGPRVSVARRWPRAGTHFKIKVGRDLDDDIRRAGLIREEIGPERQADDGRQPGVGRRRGDRADARARALRSVVDRGADEPRRRARPRAIARAIAPIGVATGEHCQNRVIFKQLLQAEAIDFCQIDACRVGGVNEVLAVLLLAAKFGVPVCPHAGGVGLCEYVQHLVDLRLHLRQRLAREPHRRVRRSPARALPRSGRRRATGATCRRPRPATASRCARRRSTSTSSRTVLPGQSLWSVSGRQLLMSAAATKPVPQGPRPELSLPCDVDADRRSIRRSQRLGRSVASPGEDRLARDLDRSTTPSRARRFRRTSTPEPPSSPRRTRASSARRGSDVILLLMTGGEPSAANSGALRHRPSCSSRPFGASPGMGVERER